jgi:hypothetical protein
MIRVTRACIGGAHASSAAATVTATKADLRNSSDMFDSMRTPLFLLVPKNHKNLAGVQMRPPL